MKEHSGLSPINTLVITLDGLNTRFLGSYGNQWVPTPSMNRLAAEGIVFDQLFSNSFSSRIQHNLLWDDDLVPNRWTPFDLLLSDQETMSQSFLDGFQECQIIQPDVSNPDLDKLDSGEVNECSLQQLFATAFNELTARPATRRIWIHSKQLTRAWIAAPETQELFKGEGDPESVKYSTPPAFSLSEQSDPDIRTSAIHAYAAEIVQIDQRIGDFFEALDEHKIEVNCLFIGIRGYPLGEHSFVGLGEPHPATSDETSSMTSHPLLPFVEAVHLPAILHTNTRSGENLRIGSVIDLHRLLDELLVPEQLPRPSHSFATKLDSKNLPEFAVSRGQGHIRLQTPAWALIQSTEGSDPPGSVQETRLYAKPDDLLEVNEVSAVCRDVVDIAQTFLREYLSLEEKERQQLLLPERLKTR